jgi:hypothetical protein
MKGFVYMGSRKCNIRSFRYSDEVASILHGYGSPDASLNDKFESLVLHCNLELPRLDKEIEERVAQLRALDLEYVDLKKRVYDERAIGRELDGVMTECRRLKMRLVDINDKL